MRGLGFILRIFLSCIGWCEGCCGTSVGEGTARGGRLLVVTRCAPYSTAAPVCCHSSQLASLKQALGGSSYPRLPTGAPLTSPPAACLPSPEIQSGRSQCDASAQRSELSIEAYRHKSTNQNKESLALFKKKPKGCAEGARLCGPFAIFKVSKLKQIPAVKRDISPRG